MLRSKPKHKRMNRFWCIALGVLPLLVPIGCGGAASSSSSVEGCEDGATRECVGRGACRGGQACASNEWSLCDCRAFVGEVPITANGGSPDVEVGEASAPGGSAGEANESESDASGGAAGEAGASQGGESPGSSRCPIGLPGPPLVMITTGAMAPYCMDATEVTREQYREFLGQATAPGDDVECEWNSSFEPSLAGTPTEDGEGCELDETRPGYPVACVDWCDAQAYCRWAGKRLCGGTGGARLSLDGAIDDGSNEAAADEWFNACAGGEYHVYPYGDLHRDGICRDAGDASLGTWPVKSSTCQGKASGVYDLVGNVQEWENACGAGIAEFCAVRGGAYSSTGSCPKSAGAAIDNRSQKLTIGIRCCADADAGTSDD